MFLPVGNILLQDLNLTARERRLERKYFPLLFLVSSFSFQFLEGQSLELPWTTKEPTRKQREKTHEIPIKLKCLLLLPLRTAKAPRK